MRKYFLLSIAVFMVGMAIWGISTTVNIDKSSSIVWATWSIIFCSITTSILSLIYAYWAYKKELIRR
ncbi:hypothetical protein FQ087_16175 [Sporosarcina sp. ANT_H38]|uniref:hypothetical protein n=1 Tax=Sporosarcina sp. ANT_H38 TaxID=2597358 RepID=UPI0011F1974D|nr:hypothetical protein [Sporosarcina sp. ANT_H38]KAA0948544.1 hypothetical protein FQ087_16175 [Sporosarcina sp. ANT_H38]